MIHSIIQYLQGYLTLCVEGDSAERFLNLCSYHKIYIWNVTIHDNVYELQIRIKDFRKIRPIARKTHTHVKIKNRFGMEKSEIISFGDNFNDLEMLEESGKAFIMENSPEDMKTAEAFLED